MKRPLISIQLHNGARVYEPGSQLTGEFQVDAVEREDVDAVELSVLWYTEGKGDEDLAVHYFERLQGPNVPLHELHRFAMHLPNSPLSYEGVLVKIRWNVRVRVFLRPGKDVYAELPFQVGAAPRPALVGQQR